MGPTGPSARRAPYFFFFLAAFFFFAIVSPPPAPRVPRLARSFATLRGGRKKCQEENTLCGGNPVSGCYIWRPPPTWEAVSPSRGPRGACAAAGGQRTA